MARAPQSRISRADPAVTQLGEPSFGSARVFETMAKGFANIAEMARPAAERQAQERGAREAIEEVRAGTFKAREGLTVADAAFNEIGSRVFVSRMTDGLAVEAERVARAKQGDPAGMAQALDGLADGLRSSLPATGTARAAFEENFGRIRNVFVKRAAKEEVEHLGDQDSAAALELFDAMGRNLRNITMAGGGAEDLASGYAELQEMLVQYGPRGAFEVNGVAYEADETRAGIFSAEQIAGRLINAEDEMKALQIRAAYNDAEDKGQLLLDMDEMIRTGELDISEKRASAIVDDLWGDLSRRNAAASAEERRETEAIRREGDQRLTEIYLRLAGMGEGEAPTPEEVQALVAGGYVSASEARQVIRWISEGALHAEATDPEAEKFISQALYMEGGDPKELMGWLAQNGDRFTGSDFASWMQKLDSRDPASEGGMDQQQRFYEGILTNALSPSPLFSDLDSGQRERIAMARDEYWRRTVEGGEEPREVYLDILQRSRTELDAKFSGGTGALVRPRGAVTRPDGSLDIVATKSAIRGMIISGAISGEEILIQRDLVAEWERRQAAK